MRRTNRRRMFVESLEQRRVFAADSLHNFLQPLDVNNDGRVEPLDALAIINTINRRVTEAVESSVQRFYDVNDDLAVSPIDALRVLNVLNRQIPTEVDVQVRAHTDESESGRVGVQLTRRDDGIEVEVRVQNAEANTDHAVFLEDRWIGVVETNERGRGVLRLQPDQGPDGLVPELLISGLTTARVMVESLGEVQLNSESLSAEEPNRPDQPPREHPLFQATVLSAGLFDEEGSRGEALFVQHNSIQFLGVYARRLTAGETYVVKIDGVEVAQATANRLGVIVERIRLTDSPDMPEIAVGSPIEIVGVASGAFRRLIDRQGQPEDPNNDPNTTASFAAALYQNQRLSGGIAITISPERTYIGLTATGLAPGSTHDVIIGGITIATVTANRVGIVLYRYDSQRASTGDLLADLPALAAGTEVQVGKVVGRLREPFA